MMVYRRDEAQQRGGRTRKRKGERDKGKGGGVRRESNVLLQDGRWSCERRGWQGAGDSTERRDGSAVTGQSEDL